MRLQQYLARSGVTSRRKAEDLIRAGRVSINDHTAEIGATVGENDVVRLDGERVRLPQKTVTIALHKPKGYTTTHEDAHAEKLVYELVPEHPGLHSVGRLDKDTEGLLLLTNDGELTAYLSHPRNQVPKLYRVWSKRGRLSQEDCRKLEAGVMLGDGLAKAVEATPVKEGAKLVLTEGRKREVRRMLGRVGHPVERLVRLAVGPIELGELGSGEWRYLSPEELRLLRSNPAMPSLKKESGLRARGSGQKEQNVGKTGFAAKRGGEQEARAQTRLGAHKSDRQKTALGREPGKAPREHRARAGSTPLTGKSSKSETAPGKDYSKSEARASGRFADKTSGEFRGNAIGHKSKPQTRKPRVETPALKSEVARGKPRSQQEVRPERNETRAVSQKQARTVESSREHLRSGGRPGANRPSGNRRAHSRTRRTDKK